jgi:hypothetical protein
VKDSAGRKLAYVYFEEEPARRSAAKLLSKDEARRIAVNIARANRLNQKHSPKHIARGFLGACLGSYRFWLVAQLNTTE